MKEKVACKQRSLAVCADREEDRERARALADHLGVPMLDKMQENELMLRFCEKGLVLTDGTLELRGDFTRMLGRLKPNNLLGENLVKAAKRKDLGERPTAIDATAGLGEDALLLAAVGFSVTLYEYDPVIAALLQDALLRARQIPELAEAVCRMHFIEADSLVALPALQEAPDLILLDPMFPGRQKSGLVKKKFQLLQQLESPCGDGEALMQAAMEAHPRKIIVKRPIKGPFLADRKPNYSIEGKGIRFDCLLQL